MNPEDRVGIKTGFSGFSEQAYRRLVDQQQRIMEGILSDIHYFTFKFLEIEESVYAQRLNKEMIIWNHREKLKKSPLQFSRREADLIES